MKLFILLVLLSFSFSQEKKVVDQVAKANKLLKEDNSPEKALSIYQEELKTNPDNPYLWYNTGNAYFKQKKFAEARSAYENALNFKDTLSLSQTNYNIGNTYLYESKLDTAISYYVKALELNDKDEDAKYNLELARAILKEKAKKEKKQNKQQQKDQKKQEASEYAKKLFEEAKELAKQFRFKEALDLMNRGLRQDPTVAAFKNFIEKLTSIVKILG